MAIPYSFPRFGEQWITHTEMAHMLNKGLFQKMIEKIILVRFA